MLYFVTISDPEFVKIFFTTFIHFFRSRLLLLFESASLSSTSFVTLPSGNLVIYPSHHNLWIFATVFILVCPYISIISFFDRLLHISPFLIPPYILLSIFLSHISSLFFIFLLRIYVSQT